MTAHPLFRRTVATLAAALALGASLAHAQDRPVVPLAADFNPQAAAATAFEVTDPATLKGLKRAAVTVFAVEFVTADSVFAQTSGFAAAGRASSALYYRLLGVGQPEFQAIAERLYADFLQRLAASGVEVVSPEQLQASPVFRKFADGAGKLPVVANNQITVGPPGLGLMGVARTATVNKPQQASLFSAVTRLGDGLAAASDVLSLHELSTALDASLLEVKLRVNFVELTNHNQGFWGRLGNTASTSGRVGPSVESVLVAVQRGRNRATLTGKQALALNPAAFTEVREKAATAGDVAGAVAVGLLRMAVGSQDTSSSKQMEAVAEPTRYSEVVGEGMAQVNALVVARLVADR